MPPLVTVVTATWGRPRTIFEHAIATVAAQDYDNIEHLIVTDGRDAELERALMDAGYQYDADPDEAGWSRRLVSLGRNWTGYSGDGAVGAIPRLVGAWMAAGEWIAYLDDDNDYLPGHISSLMEAAERGYELVCGAFYMGSSHVAGLGHPSPGNVDTSSFLHHAKLLKISAWQTDGYEGDGNLISRWIAAGVRWTVVPEPTMRLNGHRFGAPDK